MRNKSVIVVALLAAFICCIALLSSVASARVNDEGTLLLSTWGISHPYHDKT